MAVTFIIVDDATNRVIAKQQTYADTLPAQPVGKTAIEILPSSYGRYFAESFVHYEISELKTVDINTVDSLGAAGTIRKRAYTSKEIEDAINSVPLVSRID